MAFPTDRRKLLDTLDQYPEAEVTDLLERLVRATNPVAGDVDLVDHVLGIAVDVLKARRRARSWNGHRTELELQELPAP